MIKQQAIFHTEHNIINYSSAIIFNDGHTTHICFNVCKVLQNILEQLRLWSNERNWKKGCIVYIKFGRYADIDIFVGVLIRV